MNFVENKALKANLTHKCFSIFIVAATLLNTFSVNFVYSSKLYRKSFPIPINIDRSDTVAASMYINVKYQNYNLPLSDFISKGLGDKEQILFLVIEELRQQNLPSLARLVYPPGNENEEQFRNTMNAFGQIVSPMVVGANYEKMKIINQFFLGKDCMFVWGVDSKPFGDKGPWRRSFRIQKTSAKQFSWNYMPEKLSTLLVNSMQHIAEAPSFFIPQEEVKCDHEYLIAGKKDNNPVYLQFNGSRCDLDLLIDLPDPNNKVLCFYHKTFQSLIQEGPSAYADYYTKMSREKYLKWTSKMKPKVLEAYQNDMKKGRRVYYIINANPVYIVFYRPQYKGKTLRYDYIVRGHDKVLRLTNLSYNGFWDQFMEDPILFKDTILKPLLISSPKPRDKKDIVENKKP